MKKIVCLVKLRKELYKVADDFRKYGRKSLDYHAVENIAADFVEHTANEIVFQWNKAHLRATLKENKANEQKRKARLA